LLIPSDLHFAHYIRFTTQPQPCLTLTLTLTLAPTVTTRYVFMPSDLDIRRHVSAYLLAIARINKRKGAMFKGRGEVGKRSFT
jgi:hypothetical protein